MSRMTISGTIRLNTPETFARRSYGWVDIRNSVLQCREDDAGGAIWGQSYHGYAFEVTNIDSATWALISQPHGDWGRVYPHSLVIFPSKTWFDEWLAGFPTDMRPIVIACGHASDDPATKTNAAPEARGKGNA